jgi:hypothetical protein
MIDAMLLFCDDSGRLDRKTMQSFGKNKKFAVTFSDRFFYLDTTISATGQPVRNGLAVFEIMTHE